MAATDMLFAKCDALVMVNKHLPSALPIAIKSLHSELPPHVAEAVVNTARAISAANRAAEASHKATAAAAEAAAAAKAKVAVAEAKAETAEAAKAMLSAVALTPSAVPDTGAGAAMKAGGGPMGISPTTPFGMQASGIAPHGAAAPSAAPPDAAEQPQQEGQRAGEAPEGFKVVVPPVLPNTILPSYQLPQAPAPVDEQGMETRAMVGAADEEATGLVAGMQAAADADAGAAVCPPRASPPREQPEAEQQEADAGHASKKPRRGDDAGQADGSTHSGSEPPYDPERVLDFILVKDWAGDRSA
jgi:hypothetical protein